MASHVPSGAALGETVLFFDTTLRDGEQAPGLTLTPEMKLEIAKQLERLGVDLIEAGFPASSRGQLDAIKRIARSVRTPIIAALCRATRDDIDLGWEAIKEAQRSRLKVFISTSDIHLLTVLRMTRNDVVEATRDCVRRARRHTNDVQFSAQDATRTDPEFLLQVYRTAVSEGATTVNVTDTVGYALPDEFGRLVRTIRDGLPDDVIVSVHCHDDLGLATANSLAAIASGARQVDVTVNGIGERAGNCPLEEIAMIVSTRADDLGLRHGLDLREIARTSRLVSTLTGYPVPASKAVVGANVFAHESGIHQRGVLANRAAYEIMDPRKIGHPGSRIVLGKQSGRHGFAMALDRLSLHLDGEHFDRAFLRFKELADGKFPVTETDLRALVAEQREDSFSMLLPLESDHHRTLGGPPKQDPRATKEG